jgi:putative spermidine/putrescine transport system ATP-binding protein
MGGGAGAEARAMSGATIALDGVARTFPGGARAVRPTALTVAEGEILALLGPSGCGKTTLLRLIAGLETPDAGGRVLFDGADVTRLPIERRNVGMVFQSYALFPNMTVAGNVGYGLRVRGAPRREIAERVAEVLALCDATELADRPVTQLSGGQSQRVALARAVAVRPRVLLLDEPLSALDAALRERLRDELATLLRRLAITAVFVTHDQAEALAIADRVAVMRAGRVLQADAPRALYAQPADDWIARFVGGAAPLGGRLSEGRLVLPGGALPAPGPYPADAAFLVRPGGLALADAEAATLRGRVARATFLGDRLRLEIEGAAEGLLVVDADPGAEASVGARVGLSLRPGGLIVAPPAPEEESP